MGTKNNRGPSKWEAQQVCGEFVFALPPFVNPHWLAYASHDAYRPSTTSLFEGTYRSSSPFKKLQHSVWRRWNPGPTPAHWSPQQQLRWNDTTTTTMTSRWRCGDATATTRPRNYDGDAGNPSPTRRKTWRCRETTTGVLKYAEAWSVHPTSEQVADTRAWEFPAVHRMRVAKVRVTLLPLLLPQIPHLPFPVKPRWKPACVRRLDIDSKDVGGDSAPGAVSSNSEVGPSSIHVDYLPTSSLAFRQTVMAGLSTSTAHHVALEKFSASHCIRERMGPLHGVLVKFGTTASTTGSSRGLHP